MREFVLIFSLMLNIFGILSLRATRQAYRGLNLSRGVATHSRFVFKPKMSFKVNEEDDQTPTLDPMGKINGVSITEEDYLFGDKIPFKNLPIDVRLIRALEDLNKPIATNIQALTFQGCMNRKDIVIAAETGSGKTLSYLLPIFHSIMNNNTVVTDPSYPQTIILAPNKDLANQIFQMANDVLNALKRYEPDHKITIGN